MKLDSPQSAVLSAVIFSALIIVALRIQAGVLQPRRTVARLPS